MPEIRLAIVDAGPLIALSALRSLDLLLAPGLTVVIPDAVFYEAVAVAGKLGGTEILDWYRGNVGTVRGEPTEAFQAEMLLLRAQPGYRTAPDIGERAAIELIRHTTLLKGPGRRALLLGDDRDAALPFVADVDRLTYFGLTDYLRLLEEAGRIASADALLRQLHETGRHPATRDLWREHDPDVQEAITAVLVRSPVGRA